MPDPRRIVGGTVWARAEAVSKDAKRIYGSNSSTTWLRGIVLEVITQRKSAAAKRATTYVKALYMCGNTEKVTILPLQVLKEQDPREEVVLLVAAAAGENNNDGVPNNNDVPQPPPPPPHHAADNGQQPPPPQEPAGQPNINPVSSNNGRNWYEGVVDVDVNGPVPFRSLRMTCQYSGRVFTQHCDVKEHHVQNELKPLVCAICRT